MRPGTRRELASGCVRSQRSAEGRSFRLCFPMMERTHASALPAGPKQWLALVLLVLGACIHARHGGSELVGQWTTGTTAADGVHGTSATYVFKDDGTFEMSGYPPIEVRGRWRVIERSSGKLRLKLSDQEMTAPGDQKSQWSDEEGWGELTEGGRAFKYNGKILIKSAPSR